MLPNASSISDQRVYVRALLGEGDSWRSTAEFVNDLLVEDNGLLWLATNNGLMRWDGEHKMVFDASENNPFRINGGRVLNVFERANGDLVLQTQDDKLQVEVFNKTTRLASKVDVDERGEPLAGYLADLICTNKGAVYAAFNEGEQMAIYLLKGNYFLRKHTLKIGKALSQQKMKIAYAAGKVWGAIQGEGVWSFQNDGPIQVMSFDAFDKFESVYPSFFYGDKKDRLWLGLNVTGQNVFQWQEHTFVNYVTPLTSPTVELKEGAAGQLLFIGGKYPYFLGEVYLLEEKEWVDYSEYIDSSYLSIYPTSNIARSFFGVSKENINAIEFKTGKVKQWLKKTVKNNHWGNIVKGIQEDKEGNMYFLTEIRKFYKLDKLTGELVEIPIKQKGSPELDFQCGGAMHRDHAGILWFKVCDGKGRGILVRFKPMDETFTFFYLPELIRDIDIDANGLLWLVHHNTKDRAGKLSRFDIVSEQFIPMELELSIAEPRFCFSANDSTLWLGTVKGLVAVNTRKATAEVLTTENSSLESDRIIAIAKGTNTTLILGTYGGVQIFDTATKKVTLLDKTDGLSDNHVCGILPAGENNYWLSTFDGLSYFDVASQRFYNYGVEDGFNHHDFNRYAYFQAADGTNYLGTINGVNGFRTEDFAPNFAESQLGLLSVTKYYGSNDSTELVTVGLENKRTIILPPDLTYVDLSFYQVGIPRHKQQEFYAKLSPFDEDWTLVNEEEGLRYRQLPPGEYQLEVKNYMEGKSLNLTLISKTHFYKTLGFNLLLLCLGLGLIAFIAQSRIRKIRKEEADKKKIIRQMSELELSALRAQMNPHFVFNALGAIQYFIQVNEVEAADNYLTSFARLMRKYLDSSKEKLITLKSELELLSIYADLEKLRFEDLFSIEFIVDKRIVQEDVMLPSMLIQPFMENAINHGLNVRRDGKGALTIHFYENRKTLFCEIKDNGIGYENAQKNKRKGHRSRSMDIINEKIAAMKNARYMDIQVHSEPLFPKEIEFPGTRVVLIIKNLQNDDL